MTTIKYWVRGTECNFKRIGDHIETITLYKYWFVGGLLYDYKDRFNIICIGRNDIISIN